MAGGSTPTGRTSGCLTPRFPYREEGLIVIEVSKRQALAALRGARKRGASHVILYEAFGSLIFGGGFPDSGPPRRDFEGMSMPAEVYAAA
jgi:hypothetical protein